MWKTGERGSMFLGAVVSLFMIMLAAGCNAGGKTVQGEKAAEAQGAAAVQPAVRPILVRAAEPSVRQVTHTLETVGTFQPYEEVTVKAEVGGRVRKIYFDEGERVEKGALLLQIDEERYALKVIRAEAAVHQAEKGLKQGEAVLRRAEEDLKHAEATLTRYRDLFAQGIIGKQQFEDVSTRAELSRAEVDGARAEVESRRAAVGSARAELEIARKDLRDTRVLAPFAGLLGQRMISVGDMIQTMGTGEGRGTTPLFDLVQIDPLKLDGSVTDKNAAYVALGQEVRVRVWPYPDRELTGRITFINPRMDPNNKALRFKAEFSNREGLLRPGMFAHVFLVTEKDISSLFVPQEALLTQGQEHALFVVEGEKVRKRAVRAGISLDGEVEVLEGLKHGERVVVQGQSKLSDGSSVAIQ